MTGELHVVPRGDLVEHTDSEDCVCGPTAELRRTPAGDRWLLVHHALDGRAGWRGSQQNTRPW